MLEAVAPELPPCVPTSALEPSTGPGFWVLELLGISVPFDQPVSALQPAGVAAPRVYEFPWGQLRALPALNVVVSSSKASLGVERLEKPLLGSSLSGGAWQRGTLVTFWRQ